MLQSCYIYVCMVEKSITTSFFRELKQWEVANEATKNLKENMVDKPLPKTFATFGVHSALAAAMIVPVSIAVRLVVFMYTHKIIININEIARD